MRSIIYIHRLRIFDIDDREAFGFLGREEAKLNLLDGAQGRARVREIEVRHDGSCILVRRRLLFRTIWDDRSACADGLRAVVRVDLLPRWATQTKLPSPGARFTNCNVFDPNLPGN